MLSGIDMREDFLLCRERRVSDCERLEIDCERVSTDSSSSGIDSRDDVLERSDCRLEEFTAGMGVRDMPSANELVDEVSCKTDKSSMKALKVQMLSTQ